MKKRHFTLMAAALLLSGCSGEQEAEKPNFLFILVDDLGYMDVGFNNPGTFYETRNLDRLATETTAFKTGNRYPDAGGDFLALPPLRQPGRHTRSGSQTGCL